VSYANNLESLYLTPREMPIHFTANRNKIRRHFHNLLQQRNTLAESEAKMLLKAYDIPVCETCLVHDADEAVRAAGEIGYPVVMKVCSPAIMHKIDIGGVALDLQNEDAVRATFDRMQQVIRSQGLDTQVAGVTLQRMVESGESLEMILGSTTDPTFGPVIMVGLGGVATCVYRDHSIGLPPLNERQASRMLGALGCWPLLSGYRSRPAVAVDRLIEVMIRFSCLVADFPEIREFDINPLRVCSDGVIALDAAAVLNRQISYHARDPYAHLAIRPYPEQFIRRPVLRDGTEVLLRPIRPEDEALWQQLIGSSSTESIRFRFRSLFKSDDHGMAVRHCMIDYERELALVVETGTGEQRELVGVAQLITDLNHESAEYAVIVPDPWQGQGIGGLLLDYCIEVAEHWGISEITAETDPDNRRMLGMFRKRGFTSEIRRDEEVVLLHKSLAEQEEIRTAGADAFTRKRTEKNVSDPIVTS
jgi:acetyltransferase